MIYFISDTHFGHRNIIKYCNRPFQTVEEMNEKMIENWNARVTPNDHVYHLGDFCFGDPIPYLQKLNGKKHFLLGSHDKAMKMNIEKKLNILAKCGCVEFERVMEVSYPSIHIVLCHYCMRVWPRSHFNSWHLYGHSHGRLPSLGKSMDVSVEAINYMPISLPEVEKLMAVKENNFNYIGDSKKSKENNIINTNDEEDN